VQWGVPKIHIISVVGSREGIKKITDTHPDVNITVGVIDEALNEHGEVVPGLGDAGDRQFHTPFIDDDEYLMHPSKRKRSDA
jgi:uracil phosphoribosyltransferase